MIKLTKKKKIAHLGPLNAATVAFLTSPPYLITSGSLSLIVDKTKRNGWRGQKRSSNIVVEKNVSIE